MNVSSLDDSISFWKNVTDDMALGKIVVKSGNKYVTVSKTAPRVEHNPLPVLGYTTQNTDNTDRVNKMKMREESILRVLDAMAEDPSIDQRWLEIGRRKLEEAFMAINRSVFKPRRIDLPDHAAYGEKEI